MAEGIHLLRRTSVVVFEQSAQALAANNLALGLADRILGLNDLVLEPLMISFGMKMLRAVCHDILEFSARVLAILAEANRELPSARLLGRWGWS